MAQFTRTEVLGVLVGGTDSQIFLTQRVGAQEVQRGEIPLEKRIIGHGFFEKPTKYDFEKSPQEQLISIDPSSMIPGKEYVVRTGRGFFDITYHLDGKYSFKHPNEVERVFEYI